MRRMSKDARAAEACEFDYGIFGDKYSLPLREADSKTKEHILLIATIHFAKNGYATVTMRDIAKIVGIQQSSIYNHFESKEALWGEVLDHATNLYMLYFDHLDQAIAEAKTFSEVLEIIFHEPKLMRNVFTCYAFSMIQSEQFRDDKAKRIFCGTFLGYSIDFFQTWFDRCVARGMVAPFETKTVATLIMNTILIAIEMSVHKREVHASVPLEDPSDMLTRVQRFILRAVSPTAELPPEQPSEPNASGEPVGPIGPMPE